VAALAASLDGRPSPDRLRAAGILLDASNELTEPQVTPSLRGVRQRVNKQRELDLLSRRLKNRPSLETLTAGNILRSELLAHRVACLGWDAGGRRAVPLLPCWPHGARTARSPGLACPRQPRPAALPGPPPAWSPRPAPPLRRR